MAAFVALAGQADGAVRNRYGFNEGAAASALGRTIIDSVSGKHGIVRGTAGTGEASASATQLTLNGGASATAAYVDLPNGLVSGLTDGSFEAWYTMTTAQSWGRIFDFGSTDAAATMGELTAPGGGGNGQDFLFYAPARGTNLAQSSGSDLETKICCSAAVRRGTPAQACIPTWTRNSRTCSCSNTMRLS